MQRTTHSTRKINANGPGKDGFSGGVLNVEPATVFTPDVANAWQEELANVIELSGHALDAGSKRQLYDAISGLIAQATGTAVSNVVYTDRVNTFIETQKHVVNDASKLFLDVPTTAAADSHANNKWKAIAGFSTQGQGYANIYTGVSAGEARFAIVLNAAWDTSNQRWHKDVNTEWSVGIFYSGGGVYVSSKGPGTTTWTTWPTTSGDLSVGNAFNFREAHTRTSVLSLATMQIGTFSGGDGSLLAGGSRNYAYAPFAIPEGSTPGVVRFAHYQSSSQPSSFRLAMRTINWSTPAATVETWPVRNDGPTSAGYALTALDLSAVTFDTAKEYRLLWVPGSGSDYIQGFRLEAWKDAGPRNTL